MAVDRRRLSVRPKPSPATLPAGWQEAITVAEIDQRTEDKRYDD